MKKDLLLAFDIGTSSVRAALVAETGKILAFAAKELEQVTPHFGWSQQSPQAWWEGLTDSIRGVIERVEQSADRVVAVAGCGQMHGAVLLDAAGELVLEEVPLWNDKRTRELVERFSTEQDTKALLPIVANPPTVAWPAFKLAWIKQHLTKAYDAAQTILMPKDYVNFKLTGEQRIDLSEASSSYLFDVQTRTWSDQLLRLFGLDSAKLPPIGSATQLLGEVTVEAAEKTGLRPGTPVAVGAGDFPVALLGSGVTAPGKGCDITGTSTLITLLDERPATDPLISNVLAITGGWAAFTIVDASGDALRWARRGLHSGEKLTYDQIVALAEQVPAGSERLLFLPYLNGERLARQPNSRAQFFGLTNRHSSAHLYRSVMEGVAFASMRNVELMKARGYRLDRMVTAAGGARTRLWLEIKASVYNTPIVVPREPECGILGCAIVAGSAIGLFSDLESTVSDLVQYEGEIVPNPKWSDEYRKMQSLFDDLYQSSEKFWDRLES
ncbi:MAG: pentose kinase [Verrucomicrobia bacterium]|nr:pentose kinase [Verrucomicrobiota bacterium]MBV8279820.1 pentose kinase [Verrucomicrobiota bacterium]